MDFNYALATRKQLKRRIRQGDPFAYGFFQAKFYNRPCPPLPYAI